MLASLILIGLTVVSACGALTAAHRRLKGRPDAITDTRPSSPGYASVPTVSVIIPALNEEASLPWVLEHIPSWVREVVLVDGLSTDSTEAVARRLRPHIVVVHQPQRGKGAALRAGFAAATGDIVVMIDADGSTDPREMRRFVDALRDGTDFVKGSRHIAGGGSADLTCIRSTGNRALVLLTNLLFGSRFTDLCYGYCAFWRRHLPLLGLTANGFEIETELVLRAVKAGLAIREVPSHELERRAGLSNLNAFRDGARVLRTMLGEWAGHDAWQDASPISLVEVRVPSPGAAPLPTGSDRRMGDRRVESVSTAYTGPERRWRERRNEPAQVIALRVDIARSGSEPSTVPRGGRGRRGFDAQSFAGTKDRDGPAPSRDGHQHQSRPGRGPVKAAHVTEIRRVLCDRARTSVDEIVVTIAAALTDIRVEFA